MFPFDNRTFDEVTRKQNGSFDEGLFDQVSYTDENTFNIKQNTLFNCYNGGHLPNKLYS